MALGKDRAVLRQLRTLFNVGAIRELTDGQLLERFATGRGEAAELAFAVLVERHGPMVLRVCRGVLADPHDAHDAFQATFLVLVRKARGLWMRDSLGPWLHQVAYRSASCARAATARRRRHERRAAMATPEGRTVADDELPRALHEEIDRLPGRYQAAVVLCDLEGRTYEQAARHLGWPVGTVKSRLARGRERLRARLLRRGLAPHAGLLAAVPRPEVVLPPALVDSTTRAVLEFVTVRTLVKGSAALLAQGVLRSMFLTRWLKVASVVLAFGATTTGVGLVAQQGKPGVEPGPDGKAQAVRAGNTPVAAVQPGKLSVVETARGSVEASRRLAVFCQIDGGSSIISILPEGTQVKEGQLVCELDSSRLNDQLVNQRITTQGAENAYRNAQLARELAELAVREYEEGILKSERQTVLGGIKLAQEDLAIAQEELEALKKTHPDSDVVVKKARREIHRAQMALEQGETKRMVLENYTKEKTLRKLHAEVEQARSNERAKQATWELEKSKEAKLVKQIADYCKLYAPCDGIVVYANDRSRFAGPTVIEEGAAVRERQQIFNVTDLSAPMQINTKVHEPRVDRIERGQRARIRVNAFADLTLTGTVRTVAPLPDPFTQSNPNTKIYTSLVTIDNAPAGLRPGMTAEVELLINELDNVLSVPLSAVVHFDGKDQVAVKKPDGDFAWREVVLGASNDKVIEVKKGLQAGDVVALNPRSLMTEEEQREAFGSVGKGASKKDSGGTDKVGKDSASSPGGAVAGEATDTGKAKEKGKGKGKGKRGGQAFGGFDPATAEKFKNASPEERQQMIEQFKAANPNFGGGRRGGGGGGSESEGGPGS